MSTNMKNNINRFFFLLSTLVLVSCSNTFDIQLAAEVSVYFSDNNKHSIQLTKNNEEYTTLNKWLQENRSDWYATSGRYPGGVYIKSGNYGIQITNTHVVIYLAKGANQPKAIYIQTIKKGELSSISNIHNANS